MTRGERICKRLNQTVQPSDFEDVKDVGEAVAGIVDGWATVTRCMDCNRVIMVTFLDHIDYGDDDFRCQSCDDEEAGN